MEFDCAHGTIDAPLRPGAKGTFKVKGTFTPERSGPATEGGPPPVKASYEGTIEGDVMTLRVVLDGETDAVAEYTLRRHQRGNVRKCR